MADKSLTDLQEMQKLTASMVKDYDELLKGHGKTSKALKDEVALQKSIVAGIKDAVTAEEAIEKLKKRHIALGTQQLSNNKGVVMALQMQNTIVRQYLQASSLILARETKRKDILAMVGKEVDGVTGKMKEQMKHLEHELEHIPFIGKLMSKVIPYDKINNGLTFLSRSFTATFRKSFNSVLANGGGFMKAFTSGLGSGLRGIGAAAARLGPALMGPQAILVAIVAALGMGLIRLHQIEQAANAFKESTGLLNNDTKDIQRQISTVSAQYRQIGVEMKDVAEYAASFYNSFHGTQRASDAVLGSMAVLNKNFGIGVDEQTKLNHLFQSSAHLNQEQAQYMIGSVVAAADLANVAPKKVIADMAENSEAMYQYFHGSVEEMGAAAVQAAKMGTSLTQMASMADNLLNFETSLTDELNAGAILGKNFNLSIARSAAAAGDLPGMYEAVVDAVGDVGDITKLSKFQQDALVKATGMQVSELANAQHIKEKFSNANKEELAAGMELLKNGKNIHDINEDDLKTLVKKQKSQKEMQGQIHALGDMITGFGGIIMDAFLPIGQALITILTPIFAAMGAFIKGFVTPIANAFKRISTTISGVMEKFGGMEKTGKVLGKIFEFIGTLFGGILAVGVEYLLGGFEAIVDVISGVVSIVKGLFTGDMKMVGEGLKDVFKGVIGWFFRLPIALYDGFIDMFPKLGEMISSFFSNAWSKVTELFGFGKSDSGKVQEAASGGMESSGSVNDGVIQNGKIISTNPADTLIAAKNPSDILGKVMSMSPLGMLANGIGGLMGGGSGAGVDMGPLIAEIQGLRADMAAGKISINMDGKKVTSGITKIAGQSSANSYVQR
jgi:hypothetical protein